MDSTNLILHPEDVKLLEDKNLVTFEDFNPAGSRRRKLDRSWMFSEDSVQTAASADSGYSDRLAIPEQLDSQETLKYLGFGSPAAETIWERWVSIRDDPNLTYNFLQIAVGKIQSSSVDAHVDIANWVPTFQQLGVTQEMHDAIVTPAFKHIRDTESAKYWIQDTIEIRYYQLKAIQRASHNRHKKSQGSTSQFISSSSGPSGPSGARTDTSTHSRSASTGAPAVGVAASQEVPDAAPDTTVMWKGIAKERIGWNSAGKIVAGSLRSSPPSDFSGRSNDVLYFAMDRAVAEEYAQFAKTRVYGDGQSTALLRLSLPTSSWTEKFDQYYLSTEEWRKMVYLSRRGKDLEEEDIGIQHLIDRTLLIGPIAKGNNNKYENIVAWSDLSKANMMEVPLKGSGKLATQFAFLGASTIRKLSQDAIIDIEEWVI